MARPLAATKVKRQKAKGKTSESRQAGITLFCGSGVVHTEDDTHGSAAEYPEDLLAIGILFPEFNCGSRYVS